MEAFLVGLSLCVMDGQRRHEQDAAAEAAKKRWAFAWAVQAREQEDEITLFLALEERRMMSWETPSSSFTPTCDTIICTGRNVNGDVCSVFAHDDTESGNAKVL
ncbi:hypothetical protein ACMFMG_007243 [Clarireedia jacksonii]